MPSPSSSSSMNVFEMLMERDLSKKSMIKGPTLSEEIKKNEPVAKKIQKVKSEFKKISKPVTPPPIIIPTLSQGYRIPKKKTPAPSSGAQEPATTVPAAPMPLKKSLVMKKPARINEKMLHKMIVKND